MSDIRSTGHSLADTPRRPVWQRRWFQWMIGLLVGLVVVSFIAPPVLAVIYEVRAILVPVLIALGLAYVVNPLVTYAQARYRVPRWLTTSGILAFGALALFIFLLLALPPIIAQGTELVDKLRTTYPQRVVNWLREVDTAALPTNASPDAAATPLVPPAEADAVLEQPPQAPVAPTTAVATVPVTAPAVQWRSALRGLTERLRDLEWAQVSSVVGKSLDIGVGVIGTAIGFTTYLLLAVVIVVFCFFFFTWKLDRITNWFIDFIPASHKERTLEILRRMDQSIAAFVRGRLIQAAVMGVILSLGWFIAGVPYWLLLGLLSGLLNLVPFVAVVGWLLATVLTIIDHTAGPHGFTLWTLLAPTIVYMLAQGIDGWIVEPLVQGQATNLDPITVMLVVLIGGALAGLLGMLIAIPTAACIKIMAREIVLPKLRALAAEN